MFILLLALGGVLSSCDLSGSIVGHRETLRIILNGGEYSTLTTDNAKFQFKSLPRGVYFLEVLSTTHVFSPIYVDVCTTGEKIRAKNADESSKSLRHPLRISSQGPAIYFHQSPPFNPMQIVKSPMGMMGIMTLFSVFVMPKLMSGVDPQELQETMRGPDNQPASLGEMVSNIMNPPRALQ